MLMISDKGGRGVSQMLMITDKGGLIGSFWAILGDFGPLFVILGHLGNSWSFGPF